MKTDINLNINNNTDFDKQLETAYNLCCLDFSHAELLNMLKNGSIAQRQIAAIKFDYVKSADDAKSIIGNLTGCDGKIREATALKIYQLLSSDYSSAEYFAMISGDIFADATIDINANICRMVIDSAILLAGYNDFTDIYVSKLVKFAFEALDELDKFIYKDKKYMINKQLFKLYWCLEAFGNFYSKIDDITLEQILTKCTSLSEYTIREKSAIILTKSGKFNKLYAKLITDENYYVKEVFKSSTLP